MKHSEKFINFTNDLSDIKYVFFRGFINLPEKPDTDVDIICHNSQFDDLIDIANKHMEIINREVADYGFAEWTDMKYRPYQTTGAADNSIPNGRFRANLYNSFFFSSPYNNFKTKWTLPKKFNDAVLDERISYKNFYIPKPEHELVLLICRDTLDLRGKWKEKHIRRVKDLLIQCNMDELTKCITDAGLPYAPEIVRHLINNEFEKIFNTVMGK